MAVRLTDQGRKPWRNSAFLAFDNSRISAHLIAEFPGPCHLAASVPATLRTSRVINVVGPRQAGKTTLVRDMVEAAQFLNLDDETLLASLVLDAYGQLSALAAGTAEAGLPIVIGEVQRLPQITLALKRIVDRDQRPGQFLLTGSSDIFTTPKALDSLAGRVSMRVHVF
jgi:uncharacterized protein